MKESSRQQPIRDYKDLHVGQKAMALVKWIYEITRSFPSDERLGLSLKCVGPSCRFRRTLLKVKRETRLANMSSSYHTPRVRQQNSIPSFACPSSWATVLVPTLKMLSDW